MTLIAMAAAFPIMLGELGAASFGLWAALTTPTSMMGLLSVGVVPATVSLLGRAVGAARTCEGDDQTTRALDRAGALIAGTMTVSAASAVLTLVIGLPAAPWVVELLAVPRDLVPDAIFLFRAATICLGAMLIGACFAAQLDATGRVDLSALSWGLVATLNAVFLLVAVMVSPGFVALGVVQLMTAVTNVVVPLVLLSLSGSLGLWRWIRLRRSVLAEFFRLAASMGGASAMGAALDPLVKLTVGSTVGPVPVGAYELAARVVQAGSGMFAAVVYPLLAHVAAAEGQGRRAEFVGTVANTVRRVTCVAFPTLVALGVGAAPLLALWLGEDTPPGTVGSVELLSLAGLGTIAALPSYQALSGVGKGLRVLAVQAVTLGAASVVLCLVAVGVLEAAATAALPVACGFAVGATMTLLQYRLEFGKGAAAAILSATRRGALGGLAIVPPVVIGRLAGAGERIQLVLVIAAWVSAVAVFGRGELLSMATRYRTV